MGIFTEILGMIFLPIIIIIAFGMMTGAKVEGIISSMFSIVAELVKGTFKILVPVLIEGLRLLTKLISASIKLAIPQIQNTIKVACKQTEEFKIILKEKTRNERK